MKETLSKWRTVMPSEPTTTDRVREVNFCVELCAAHHPTREQLEDEAIRMEQTLIRVASELALGPSVSVNFANGSLEVDVTFEATSLSQAYGKLAEMLSRLEETGDFRLEVRDDRAPRATASAPIELALA